MNSDDYFMRARGEVAKFGGYRLNLNMKELGYNWLETIDGIEKGPAPSRRQGHVEKSVIKNSRKLTVEENDKIHSQHMKSLERKI